MPMRKYEARTCCRRPGMEGQQRKGCPGFGGSKCSGRDEMVPKCSTTVISRTLGPLWQGDHPVQSRHHRRQQQLTSNASRVGDMEYFWHRQGCYDMLPCFQSYLSLTTSRFRSALRQSAHVQGLEECGYAQVLLRQILS